jgi:hypothetical protein
VRRLDIESDGSTSRRQLGLVYQQVDRRRRAAAGHEPGREVAQKVVVAHGFIYVLEGSIVMGVKGAGDPPSWSRDSRVGR